MPSDSPSGSSRWLRTFWGKLTRRKVIRGDMMDTSLDRKLSLTAVILIGIGHMAGGGAFVVLGTAALYAGPGVVISFAIGGVVAFVTGACYAEFAATIPKAGSGYLFSYVTLGEFVAFIVGWQVILEELISAASMSSAISGAIDSMTRRAITNFTVENIGTFNVALLGPYPDFVALGIGLVSVTALGFGVKNTVSSSNVLNAIQLVVILFCIIAGFCFYDFSNWTFNGFFPYGFAGVMKGAAASFFAFIGFEGIACSGEETKDPQKTIPIALFTSIGIMAVLYLFQAAALTLMIPYNEIDPQSAFPEAFVSLGYPAMGIVVGVGIIVGLIGGLISGLYTMTRVTYAMASDGLLFKIFSKVNARTKTPLFGEIFFGVLAACLALLLNLEILVEFLNVGTLITYTIVAGCSIILHYQPRVTVYDVLPEHNLGQTIEADADGEDQLLAGTLKPRFAFLRFMESPYPGFSVDIAVLLFAIFVGGFYSLFVYALAELLECVWWTILLAVLLGMGVIAAYIVIIAHRQRRLILPYEIPSVPFIPALSIALNILLLVNLTALTWLRFLIWFALGLLVYFTYGIRFSELEKISRGEVSNRAEQPVVVDESIIRDPNFGISDMPTATVNVDEKMALLSHHDSD